MQPVSGQSAFIDLPSAPSVWLDAPKVRGALTGLPISLGTVKVMSLEMRPPHALFAVRRTCRVYP